MSTPSADNPSIPEAMLVALIKRDIAIMRERARRDGARIVANDVDPRLTGERRKIKIRKSINHRPCPATNRRAQHGG